MYITNRGYNQKIQNVLKYMHSIEFLMLIIFISMFLIQKNFPVELFAIKVCIGPAFAKKGDRLNVT